MAFAAEMIVPRWRPTGDISRRRSIAAQVDARRTIDLDARLGRCASVAPSPATLSA
jgi:hypothetical protein